MIAHDVPEKLLTANFYLDQDRSEISDIKSSRTHLFPVPADMNVLYTGGLRLISGQSPGEDNLDDADTFVDQFDNSRPGDELGLVGGPAHEPAQFVSLQ